MIAPGRLAAYDVLRAVSTGRADLPTALARVRTRLPDERDRALAGEIAAGTLRWQGAFDRVIASFAGRPATRLDPEVLDILRMTAFQLLHLDRIPASAAVNDAVDLARNAGKQSAGGLVNAVLRRISRERARLPLPSRPENPGAEPGAAIDYLAGTLSHPEWLVTRWVERHGFESAEAWARFDNAPAALTLRANTLRTTRDTLTEALAGHGVTTEPARFASHGLVVLAGNPLLTPLAHDGLFSVQDESSQLVAELAGVQPGERILDACASPGGKTTAMAASMADRGLIVATDLRGRRVDLLARTIAAAGASCVRVVRADTARAVPFGEVFDCVLLDAPCSGLGTLRRDPEIRWRRAEAELADFAATQEAMLDQVAGVTAPGGRLLYSTCSSEPDENEAVVARFLSSRPEFALAPAGRIPAGLAQFLTPDGYFRTYPFRDQLEAFFAAMLVKNKDLR
ncbi:MAG: 16S rRNA (cytosine(967)-C(5))-methyltransferase RsmB [Vicinamibacterales bacterium]